MMLLTVASYDRSKDKQINYLILIKNNIAHDVGYGGVVVVVSSYFIQENGWIDSICPPMTICSWVGVNYSQICCYSNECSLPLSTTIVIRFL